MTLEELEEQEFSAMIDCDENDNEPLFVDRLGRIREKIAELKREASSTTKQ